MHGIPSEIVKSLRRSRVRARSVRYLARAGEGYLADVARAVGTDAKAVRWAFVGHPPHYRRERSLVRLGLVRRRSTPDGVVYSITALGLEVAAALGRRRR